MSQSATHGRIKVPSSRVSACAECAVWAVQSKDVEAEAEEANGDAVHEPVVGKKKKRSAEEEETPKKKKKSKKTKE